MTETLAYGYSSESTQRELSCEYLHARPGLDGYQKNLNPFALDVSSLSIGRVKIHGSYSTSCLGSVYFWLRLF